MTVQKILIVDDAPADRLMLSRCLRARQPDIEIVQVERAEEALVFLRQQVTDCMFLDIHLPGHSGIEFLEGLRQAGLMPCAVVAMTGSGSDRVAVEALKSGAHDYLPKGRVNEVSLWDALAYAVSRYQLQRETRQRELQLEELNQELERKDRIKTQFVANASHELRTPVAAITGLIGLMQRTELVEEQRKLISSMKSCCDTLLLVVDDLIDLTKIESGALELHNRPFRLGQVCEQVLETVQILAQDKGLELHCRVDSEISRWVHGDPSRLRQILYNLVGNAIKFTPSGSVSISVAEKGADCLRFEVMDSGIGISEAVQQRLFEPHFQTGSLDHRAKGSGLGLAIVRSLVQRMGGEVGVLSRPGRGSTFWFEVPLAGAPEGQEESAPTAQGSQHERGFRLLVAEDNPIAARVLALQLQHLGHEVTVVSDGRRAVELASSGQYQAVIMDCQMPELDGFEATRRLRESYSQHQLPIIALTANALLGESTRCQAAGMNDYLVKPAPVADLQRLLEHWVAR
ncbi:MAG: response regulator [Candidatus Eremiobacteraeota bacterium]|nr:response regulator [Candidatus Eremiobacteraeota bacterium]